MTRARQLAADAWNYVRPRVRWRGLVPVVLFGLSILFTVHYYKAEQASQQHQAAQQAAAQRAQGAALEQKLCTSLGRLAGLRPPPGPAAGNPSRAYLLQQHQVLAELGPDVGCGARR